MAACTIRLRSSAPLLSSKFRHAATWSEKMEVPVVFPPSSCWAMRLGHGRLSEAPCKLHSMPCWISTRGSKSILLRRLLRPRGAISSPSYRAICDAATISRQTFTNGPCSTQMYTLKSETRRAGSMHGMQIDRKSTGKDTTLPFCVEGGAHFPTDAHTVLANDASPTVPGAEMLTLISSPPVCSVIQQHDLKAAPHTVV